MSRHTRSLRKGKWLISKLTDENIYIGERFLDLPVGAVIVTKNDARFEIIFKDGQKHCMYVDINGDRIASPITNDEFWTVREDERVEIPYGYESPLWKVLNGEDIE